MNSIEIQNGINHIYKNDKKLAQIIDAAGTYNLTPKKDYFFALVRSIIGQQLSVKAADSILKRFIAFFNNKPTSQKIIAANDEDLRQLGISYSKIKYIKDLAKKISAKEISFRNINKMENEIILNTLIQVKGIGEWTVHMFLMFTLIRLDILPVSDHGIKRAAMSIYNLRKLPDAKRLSQISKKNNWAPYNSVACWYLWKSLDLN